MIKFINEIALITAVSDLSIFLDIEKEVVLALAKIDFRSLGEKSPSGPINIVFKKGEKPWINHLVLTKKI